MFTLKLIFAICEVITGFMFIACFGSKNTDAIGRMFCSISIIQFLIFVWIVASREFF